MAFRTNFTSFVFATLLIWGPVDSGGWPVIRIAYLIVVPFIVWLLLGWMWNRWQPSEEFEIKLNRVLSSIIVIGLFAFAIIYATSSTHIGNTMKFITRDGYEDVGDDVVLPEPDYGNALVIAGLALFVLWYGVLKAIIKKP